MNLNSYSHIAEHLKSLQQAHSVNSACYILIGFLSNKILLEKISSQLVIKKISGYMTNQNVLQIANLEITVMYANIDGLSGDLGKPLLSI